MFDVPKIFAGHSSADSRKPATDGRFFRNSIKLNESFGLKSGSWTCSAEEGLQMVERRILPNTELSSAVLGSHLMSSAISKLESDSNV